MKKILLVDDSTIVRNTLKTGLSEHYEIFEAADGQQGLEVAQGNPIDLFIVDVNMPVMDGIELTANLRNLGQYKATPIIMLTTESRADKRELGKTAGANGWMVKPCDSEKLLGVISKLI